MSDSAAVATARRAPLAAAAALFALVPSYVLGVYLPSFNTRHVALESVTVPRSTLAPTPALARRVAVVVVDGVSLDVARGLEELAPLRRAGVLRGLEVEFPSYTSPGLTAMFTGLGPRDSGVRLNGENLGVMPFESVGGVAEEAGVTVRLRTRGWKPFEELVRAKDPEVTPGKLALATEMWAARFTGQPRIEPLGDAVPARELTFVYIGEADAAGHLHGAASAEYVDAARRAATLVARFAETLDLRKDAIVVVSDHGHLKSGGHGGAEPEVLRAFMLAAGSFVRRGIEVPERPMRDVASTLALIAGLRPPAHNLGRPMLDLFELDDEQHAFTLSASFDEATRLTCALYPSSRCAETTPMLERLRRPDGSAWRDAEVLFDALGDERASSLTDAAERSATRRVGILAALLGGAALVARARRGASTLPSPARPLSQRITPVLAPLLLFAAYASVLVVQGYRPTFSKMTDRDAFAGDAAIAAALGALVGVLVARRLRAGPWWLLAGTAVPFAVLAAWAGASPAALPAPVAGVSVFLLAPAVVSAAIAATALVLLERTVQK